MNKLLFIFQVITNIALAIYNTTVFENTQFLDKQNYYQHVDSIMKQKQNETNENFIKRGRRFIQQNQETHSLRITYDIFKENDQIITEELQTYIESLLDTAFSYYQSLLYVKHIDQNNTFYLKELNNCLGFLIESDHFVTGIEESDLHLYISFKQSDTDIIASAGHCYIDPFLQRPTFGRILLNLSYFQKINRTNLQFFRDLQSIMHETLHILGFSTASMNYWIDPETNEPYTFKNVHKILKQKMIDDREVSVLSSANILKTIRVYYGCESIEGMLLENQGSDYTKNQHWERSILMNELMSGSSNPEGGVFSLFNIALLRDTGFWDVVDENQANPIYWGKNQGCQFYENKCQADLKYDEFEDIDGIFDCSFTGEGFGVSQTDPFSDDCPIIYPTDSQLCINYEQYQQPYKIDNKYQDNLMFNYSTQSRCFKSTISLDDSAASFANFRCLKSFCNEEGTQVTIQIDQLQIDFICKQEGQTLLVEDGTKSYGKIICPKSFPRFCSSFQNICPQFCSQNGYCVKGKCHCNRGFFGNDCSQRCNEENEDGQCAIKCPPDQYINPDRTCSKDCPQGYFKNSESKTCEKCDFSCSKCNGPSNQNCLDCHILSYLKNNTCVSECGEGYFKNKQSKQCQKCIEGCVKCSNDKVCEECDALNGYIQSSNLCKNTFCDSQCLTCVPHQKEKCTSCSQDYYLDKTQQTCQDSNNCPPGYYSDYEKRECIPCDEGCLLCKNSSYNCQSCDETKNYTLFGNKCFQLINCFSPCKTCLDESNSVKCATCVHNYYLQGEECVEQCSIGYYLHENKCLKCNQNCESCINHSDNCMSCSQDKQLSNSKCYSKCMQGQIWVNGFCVDRPVASYNAVIQNRVLSAKNNQFQLLILCLLVLIALI
ncbi:hypothetical protein ABPG74_016638 [Tetrahymena malaccensis]